MSVSPVAIGQRVASASKQQALQDAAFLVALSTIGMLGFRATYGGSSFLIVALVGLVLGVSISEILRRLGQPVVAELAVTVVVFLLLGGAIAGAGSGFTSAIPTPHTLGSLFEVSRRGWKELLTTQPPVGDTQGLLAIPYIIGLLAGVSGYSLARRTRLVVVPAIAPAAVLALGILFGTTHPEALFLQGSVFAAGTLAWMTLRSRRVRKTTYIGEHGHARPLMALMVIAAATLIAPVIEPFIPFADANQRVVLTRYVIPPFDANNLSSPLADFRQYTPDSGARSLAKDVLFTVKGVQPNGLMRIATMDSYDGLIWGFGVGSTGAGSAGADSFYRYGSVIPASYRGVQGTVTVSTGHDRQVWLPDIGEVTGIRFNGQDSAALTRDFRYDPATGTAADPSATGGSVTYKLSVVVTPTPTEQALAAAAAGSDHLDVAVPPAIQTAANQWAGGTSGAWSKVMKLADHLRSQGKFSNGTEEVPLSTAGHSAGRLTDFLNGSPIVGKQIVGDDEQYAATLALMADSLGVPARVVLGAQVPAGGVVKGVDVHAWVEVELSGLGWVTVDPSKFLPKATPAQVQPQTQEAVQSQTPVAPPTLSVLRTPPDNLLPQSAVPSKLLEHIKGGGFHIPGFIIDALEFAGIPVIILVAAGLFIAGLKGRRRRRRREVGSAPARIAAGWRELLDYARDQGVTVPGRHTRREQAGTLPSGWDVGGLAKSADAAIFGPGEPTAEVVGNYWQSVDEVISRLRSQSTRWERIKGAINPASLLGLGTEPVGL